MAGRKPKPTKLKLIEGNPGKRPLNDKEPKPKACIPECPEWVSPEGKKEWKKITPRLLRLGLLSEIDYAALGGYCDCYGELKPLREEIKLYGYTTTTDKGNVVQRPEVGIYNQKLEKMLKFLSEFGMSPSSRTRLRVELNNETDEADETEGLLSGLG